MTKIPLVVVMFLAIAVLGCDEDRARNDARLFLDRYETIEEGDLAVRRHRVDGLARLSVGEPEVVATRDACAAMHDAMLRAEEATAAARQAVAAVEAAAPSERTDPAAAADRHMAAAREALTQVPELEEPCRSKLRDLRARHAGGRRD